MTAKNTDWEVLIEYGPTAADTHFITVSAGSEEDALDKGQRWADANMRNAYATSASEIFPDDANDPYNDDIEWTVGEEEEFLRMLDNPESNE